MSKILLEDLQGPFVIDRSKKVTESKIGELTAMNLPGTLSLCNVVNGNNRIYPEVVWKKNMSEDSILMKSIAGKSAFGTLEHPKDGHVDLNSPISHLLTKAQLLPNGVVEGEITIVRTEEGKKLLALIEAGYNPLVSSRGYGSLVKRADGVDEVQEDFVCEGWDVVYKPSFVQAQLTPQKVEKKEESVSAKPESKPISEVKTESPTVGDVGPGKDAVTEHKTGLKNDPSSAAVVVSPAMDKSPIKTLKENMKDIQARLNALRAMDPSKLDAQRFSEGLREMQELHTATASYIAEDAKRSWEGNKLHNEIESLENSWSEAMTQPSKKAGKLEETLKKALQVLNIVAETAKSYKKNLAEKTQTVDRMTTLVSQCVARGKEWKNEALKKDSKLSLVEKRFEVSCEALDLMAKQYHEDVTALGKKIIVLEFAEKAKTPEIEKMLKEAKKPIDIVAIREKLDPKPVAAPAAPAAEATAAPVPAAPAPATEAKKENTAAPAPVVPAAPAAPAPATESIKMVSSVELSPKNINESIAMAKRLSKALVS